MGIFQYSLLYACPQPGMTSERKVAFDGSCLDTVLTVSPRTTCIPVSFVKAGFLVCVVESAGTTIGFPVCANKLPECIIKQATIKYTSFMSLTYVAGTFICSSILLSSCKE